MCAGVVERKGPGACGGGGERDTRPGPGAPCLSLGKAKQFCRIYERRNHLSFLGSGSWRVEG